MIRQTVSIIICCMVCVSLDAQQFRTEAYSDRVKTLRVNLVDNWQAAPYINLDGDAAVEINFDLIVDEPETLTYTLTHCDANWMPSDLLQSEFMDGFQDRIINDYAISLNTSMSYVNYRMEFPNEDVSLKISGNYAVQVFAENSDEMILCACFSVIETNVDIEMSVTSQTDKGMNSLFQQVGFTVKCGDLVKSPMNDLKVHVLQNERTDNMAKSIKPLYVQNRLMKYEHNPSLIFEAGNEYRKFEMTTRKFNGYHIESINFHDPYFHATLYPDAIRNGTHYEYYDDINGRIYIRTLDGSFADYEADYYIVHFFLPAAQPFPDDVYILSHAFNNLLNELTLMEYSEYDGGYVKNVIMKEGYYNYMYVTRGNNQKPASPHFVEGNYYQTENEYRVLVYFRRAGDRFDRLIGTETIQYK